MNKNITFSLDEDLINELKKAADETMIPQSKLVRLGIELVLKKLSKGQTKG